MKRKCIFLYILLCIMAVLTGCEGVGQQTQKAEAARKEIVIWAWDETFNVKAAKLAAKAYMVKNDSVNITVETKEREEILSDTKNILSAKAY